jgi:hypothetical protein
MTSFARNIMGNGTRNHSAGFVILAPKKLKTPRAALLAESKSANAKAVRKSQLRTRFVSHTGRGDANIALLRI